VAIREPQRNRLTKRELARSSRAVRRVLVGATYVALAAALVWSRLAGIRSSLWHDEIYTVRQFIVPGPSAIFGDYNPNDHILLSVVGWLTVRLPGLGDTAYRVWSVVPFIAAVTVVTVWLHRRAGYFVAVLFALLCTTSSQLLILSTEARGYGLAFCAMAVMTVAAYEAFNSSTSGWLTLFAVAGVAGCWTLPTFALPFIATSAVLSQRVAIRRGLVVRFAVASVAIAGWYALPASALVNSRTQKFGVPLPWHAPLTGAATELAAAYIPSLNAAAVFPMLAVTPVLAAGIYATRKTMPGLLGLTVIPVVFTFSVLTITRFYVEERFLSYLLLPIFVLTAFGFKRLTTETRMPHWFATTTYSTVLIVAGLLVFAIFASRHGRLPREANRDAAGTVSAALAVAERPVIFNTHAPDDVLYYLKGVNARRRGPGRVERTICSPALRRTGAIFVQQPFGVRTVPTACLTRYGAHVRVWRQWDRGLSISVWVLPPSPEGH
jgi:hypothetical protein